MPKKSGNQQQLALLTERAHYHHTQMPGVKLSRRLHYAADIIRQETVYDADGSPIDRRCPELAEGFNSAKYDDRLKIV
jgi:hypothetical protein